MGRVLFAGTNKMIMSSPPDENTVLLLHANSFNDSSANKITLSNNGVTISDSNSKFGGKSFYFNGSSFISMTSPEFGICAGDFTIDWWQYRENTGTLAAYNVLNTSGYSQFLIHHMDGSNVYISYAGDTWLMNVNKFTVNQNKWEHFAIVHSGTSLYFFQNGALVYSGVLLSNFTAGTGQVLLGCHADSTNRDYFKGYIDEFRVSNVARWTAAFTPPNKAY